MISVGDRVRCTTVDRYGFNGRDFHPVAGKDVGFTGIVVSVEQLEPYPGEEEDEEGPLYCYRVCRPSDGKVLDLMSHEVVAECQQR